MLYDNNFELIDELNILIDKITNVYRIEKNYELATRIALEIIQEIKKTCTYTEEIGDIDSFNYDVIHVLEQMCYDMKGLDFKSRENIFNMLIKKVKYNKDTFWCNYTEDIIGILMQFSYEEIFRQTIKMFLTDLIGQNDIEFNIERLSKMLFDILNEYGNKDDCEAFIKENLHFETFREIMINRCIAENSYEKVIELASEGERLANNTWDKGIKWKEIRYRAYVALNRIEDRINLAKELFLDGNFDYYNELKNIYQGNEKEIYIELKEALKNNNMNWRAKEMYIKLIDLESDVDEIMNYVRENNLYIEKYADILIDKYYSEVKGIYIELIKKEANSANSRSRYNSVCQSINRARKILKDDIDILVKEFYIIYKRKPAFIYELNHINVELI